MLHFAWRFTVLLVLCSLAVGCSSSTTVSGKVTLDGKPLPTGEVMFHPTAGGAMSIGSISKGSYQLATGQSDNVAPGSYNVTIIAVEQLTPEQMEAALNATGVEPTGKTLTPPMYADASTSPLKAEVKQGGNTFNFDLKSSP